MVETSLRRRGYPVGLALGLVSLAGVIADIVGCSQILVLGGADSLLLLYPISGVGLALPAVLLVPLVDQWDLADLCVEADLGQDAQDALLRRLAPLLLRRRTPSSTASPGGTVQTDV